MNSLDPPNNIDYSLYHNTNGCATKIWGPQGWGFLFTSIIGGFPVKVESNEELLIAKYYKRQIHALAFTMPCVFCRESFKQFYIELPIENYLDSRIRMIYWLYLIKDKVNTKLLKQEKICLNDEKLRLKSLYKNKEITKEKYYELVNKFKQESFKTIPTPPFQEVLDKYESIRAICSIKSLSCILPPAL